MINIFNEFPYIDFCFFKYIYILNKEQQILFFYENNK